MLVPAGPRGSLPSRRSVTLRGGFGGRCPGRRLVPRAAARVRFPAHCSRLSGSQTPSPGVSLWLWASAVCVSGGLPTRALGPGPQPRAWPAAGPSRALSVCSVRSVELCWPHHTEGSTRPPGHLGTGHRAWCRGWRGAGRERVGPRAPWASSPGSPRPSRSRPPLPAEAPLATSARSSAARWKPREPAWPSHGAAAAVRCPGRSVGGAWRAGASPGAARLPGALTHSVEEAWAAHQATGPGGQAVG